MTINKGVLYGIGVGPGDPELITLKAVNILKKVDIVFTAASVRRNYSLAVNIAKPHIDEKTEIRILKFSMVKDRKASQKSWENNAKEILCELEKGKNAAFLTVGDPLTYSTFGYILKNIINLSSDTSIVTIPGITSYQAAAARINTPLVEDKESLLLTSGAYGGDNLRKCCGNIENVVMLKAYRNLKDNINALEETGMLEKSKGIAKCGRMDEQIVNNVKDLLEMEPDYWTLILAKGSTLK